MKDILRKVVKHWKKGFEDRLEKFFLNALVIYLHNLHL